MLQKKYRYLKWATILTAQKGAKLLDIKLSGLKKWRLRGIVESDLFNKMQPQPKKVRFFFKSQTLTPGSFVALWPGRMHSNLIERSIFFLQYLVLKNCNVLLLRWFKWAQSIPVCFIKWLFSGFGCPYLYITKYVHLLEFPTSWIHHYISK